MMRAAMNRPLIYSTLLLLIAVNVVVLVAAMPRPQTGTLSTTNPTAPTVDSPLSQNVLLPTVTPTPIPTATPLSTTLITFTVAPELLPLQRPYESDIDEIADNGISYITRTNAGFGRFQNNDISPCLCKSLTNGYECSVEIEKHLLTSSLPGVVRVDECLSIDLADNRLVVFNNVLSEHMTGGISYTYAKTLPALNAHLLRMQYFEGNEYLFVDANSGALTRLGWIPIVSPDNRRIAFMSRWSFLQIWRFEEEGPRYETGWSVANLPFVFDRSVPAITWSSAESFQLHWILPDGYASPPSEEITFVLEPAGWVAYYQEQRVVEKIVGPDSIKFANGGQDRLLGKMAIGEPVYTDQPYRFTAVPDQLVGATYFRIPQNYYLGEDPSYFPLEQQMAHYLHFQVTGDATVYVALDGAAEMPDWMQAGWELSPLRLETDDVPLRLYSKHYAQWEWVELVDKWMTEGRVPSQFVVMVVADAGAD